MPKRDYTKYNKRIAEKFIEKYNQMRGTNYHLPACYRDTGEFPDVTLVNDKDGELKLEIVRVYPTDFDNKISSRHKLNNLFRKNGVIDGFRIIISLRQGITEKNIVEGIKKDKNFFPFVKGKCEEINKTNELTKEFRKNLPLGSKIRQITVEKRNGSLEVYTLSLDTRLNPFADLKGVVLGKLKKYTDREIEISDALLLLDGLSRPIPLGDGSHYIEEIKKSLVEIKQSSEKDKFFKEVWLLSTHQEEEFVEQVI